MKITAQRTRHARPRPYLILGLVLLITLAASACTFEVQPIEEYTSADGFLSLTFPASWDVLDEAADGGMTSALVGTEEDLVMMDVFPPGEAALGIMLMPNFLPAPDGEELTLAPEELAALMQQSAMTEQPNVGEVGPVTLPGGRQAYSFESPSPEADMTVYVFAPAEETLAAVALITASGEEDAALLADAQEILGSIEFEGDPAEFVERARVLMGLGE